MILEMGAVILKTIVAFSMLLLLPSIAPAQQVVAIPVSCAGCGGERYHHSHCHAVQKGAMQKDMPAAFPQESPAGQYVAPPANGPVFGESNSVGVEGLGLHFPQLNLQLPTLKLPSLFRVRNNARMVTNPSEAPFMEGVPASAPVQLMMVPSSPPAAPLPDPGAADAPVQQFPSQKSPVQQDYKGVSNQQAADVSSVQMEEIRRLQLQLQDLHQVVARLEATTDPRGARANSVSSRLPSTQEERRRNLAQPANHVEPARLPYAVDGLQRLPIPR